MSVKLIFFTLSLLTFTTQAFSMPGDIFPPNLSNWDGKSDVNGWVPDPKRTEKVPSGLSWYLYHMWILNQREGQPGKFCTNGRDDYPLHVILKSPKGFTMSFCKAMEDGKPIVPSDFYFEEDPSEKGMFLIKSPYFKEGVETGHKFDAWKGIKTKKDTSGRYVLPSEFNLEPNYYPKSAIFRRKPIQQRDEE